METYYGEQAKDVFEQLKGELAGSSSNNNSEGSGDRGDDKKKKKEEKKESSVGQQLLDNTPIIGKGMSSGDKLAAGDYLGSLADFGTALAEMFTFGFASEVKLGTTLVSQTVERVAAKEGSNLVEALSKVGGNTAASEFLGWGNKTAISKTATDFTKAQLLEGGYTKQVLQNIYSGLMNAAKKTIANTGQLNPASVARAQQIQQILKTHF
jgi:hypothetical protein